MSTKRCARLRIAALLLCVSSTHAQQTETLLDAASYRSLLEDARATRIGDVLTVVVQEAASASSSADLRTRRDFSITARAASGRTSRSAAANLSTDNDGAGRTQRSGRLLAQLSVRVVDVNGAGDLVVAGQQSLRINGEEQLITLSGVVRRIDIASDNTVLSSHLADARIRFDGAGFVTDQSRPSWLARLLSFLGL